MNIKGTLPKVGTLIRGVSRLGRPRYAALLRATWSTALRWPRVTLAIPKEPCPGVLRALCPDDDPGRDTAYYSLVRVAAATTPSGRDAAPLVSVELVKIIGSLPHTAPGLDGIISRIIRLVWRTAQQEVTRVYDRCVIEGIFPEVWKRGHLLVLPKGNARAATDPKAYRLITPLSVLGKILKRIILKLAVDLTANLSTSQHGFTTGRSTRTALNSILGVARDSTEKYVQCIFFDISGAFDMEPPSRFEIERRPQVALDLIREWGGRNRLGFSQAKSCSMTVKGKLQRPPTVRMGGDSIRVVSAATVLGVIIDDRLSFAQHALSIGERVAKSFGKMSRVSAASWGMRYPSLLTIYRGTFLATVTYAAGCTCSVHVVRSALLRTQRPALTLSTKAYRTTSTAALPVLAGVLPADFDVTLARHVDLERDNLTRAEVGALRRRVKEVAWLYEVKRGKDLGDTLVDRELEKPGDLPHPAHVPKIGYENVKDMDSQTLDRLAVVGPHIYTDESRTEGKIGAALTEWRNGKETWYSTTVFPDPRFAGYGEKGKDGLVNVFSDSRSALELTGPDLSPSSARNGIMEFVNTQPILTQFSCCRSELFVLFMI
ncbi:Retrovirus-related Pol polyprotein from type-1 retrotransposable element R1 [Eumeta japonica]|uniref:Retrovirus-related Pol polyprotein from type-1 retrotransposable element R1 n=1 Tax=Eumeta variegata TaxID=151549 RepID=A0A4C1Z3E8_EUMVA|nr:Retrovirus-related Pol polyprotein from type-1 retrotransposable element R1 [Eumeta japonica]